MDLSKNVLYYPAANNKGIDQTARMCRLICVVVVRVSHKTGFLMTQLRSMQYCNISEMHNVHVIHSRNSSNESVTGTKEIIKYAQITKAL